MAGDFNHTNLKTVLPKFYKNSHYNKGKQNTGPVIHKHTLSLQDPPMPSSGTVRPCFPVPDPCLQASHQQDQTPGQDNADEDTEWELFEHTDFEQYTDTVLSYINFCTDNISTEKQIKVFPNQKP